MRRHCGNGQVVSFPASQSPWLLHPILVNTPCRCWLVLSAFSTALVLPFFGKEGLEIYEPLMPLQVPSALRLKPNAPLATPSSSPELRCTPQRVGFRVLGFRVRGAGIACGSFHKMRPPMSTPKRYTIVLMLGTPKKSQCP